MINYLKNKLLLVIPTMIGITLLAFILLQLAPSDPALISLTLDGTSAPTEVEIASKRHELGLDKPYIEQYISWLRKLLVGDWGNSYITNENVLHTLLSSSQITILLTLLALLIIVSLAIPMGIILTLGNGILRKHIIEIVSIFLSTIPSFWLSIISIQFFAEYLGWFPTNGYDSIYSLVLPAIVLSLPIIGRIIRVQRVSLEDVAASNYVLFAKAKGLPLWHIIYKYMLQNSFVSMVSMMGTYGRALLGGSVIVEVIFSLPGLGSTVLQAIQMRDYPVIQGYIVMMSFLTILLNLCIDLAYVWLQPKVALGGYNES